MKEIFKTILVTIIRTIVYPILYTVGFGLLTYLFRSTWFHGYSLIDQYILIIYIILGLFIFIISDFLYRKSVGIFLMPTILFVIYLSYFIPPSQIPHYTYVGNCSEGDFYLEYSGPRNGNTYLVYNSANKSVPADVNMNEKEIQFHGNISQYDEECVFDPEYNVSEYTL